MSEPTPSRWSSIPDSVILYMANEMAEDFEAFQFGRTEKRMATLFRQYGIKRFFSLGRLESVGQLPSSAKAKGRAKPSSSSSSSSTSFKIGVIRNVVLGKSLNYDGAGSFQKLPPTVKTVLFKSEFIVPFKDLASLPASLTELRHMSLYQPWYVQLSPSEYASRGKSRPLELPSTLRSLTMPAVFVGPIPKRRPLTIDEVDSSHFIKLPNGLTHLTASPSKFLHTVTFPDSLETFVYGGNSSSDGDSDSPPWPTLPTDLKTFTFFAMKDSSFRQLRDLPRSLTEINFPRILSTKELAQICLPSGWPPCTTNIRSTCTVNSNVDQLSFPPRVPSLQLVQHPKERGASGLDKMRLPESLTRLRLKVDSSLEHLRLPPTLTALEIKGFIRPISLPRCLPESLTTLRLYTLGQTDYKLPPLPNLTSLLIPSKFDPDRLAEFHPPPSVTEIDFHCEDESWLRQLKFPPNLRKLILGQRGTVGLNTPKFDGIQWPVTLTELIVNFVVVGLHRWNPPPSLTRLDVNEIQCVGLKKPSGKKNMADKPILSDIILPANLRDLTIRESDKLMRYMLEAHSTPKCFVWPAGLTRLRLDFQRPLPTADILPNLFPNSLDTLFMRLYHSDELVLSKKSLPSQLRCLYLQSLRAQYLIPPEKLIPFLPVGLETLAVVNALDFKTKIGRNASRKISKSKSMQLPPSLKTLWVDNRYRLRGDGWNEFIHRDPLVQVQFRDHCLLRFMREVGTAKDGVDDFDEDWDVDDCFEDDNYSDSDREDADEDDEGQYTDCDAEEEDEDDEGGFIEFVGFG